VHTENWGRREVENSINAFSNFTIPIQHKDDTFDIHFVALFSQKQDAIPVMLLHGWPGNFMEFLSIMKILTKRYTPATLPYHIIVPSLPGYAFSSPPPLTRGFQIQDIASIMNGLMTDLGFGDGYVVQGGDIGSKVARVMAATFDTINAIHSEFRLLLINEAFLTIELVNFCIMPRPEGVDDSDITDLEKEGLDRAAEFKRLGSAYALMHATKPSTIGLVLAASPLSLLAWYAKNVDCSCVQADEWL
jgi:microsomal epoxide hydrolase